ncbi:cytochrome P450 2J6-like [Mizuhopecten yessoensis]|uniref:Cytochrome P450 2J6 n=1 Tax=Mizuhopecten yessoensis TaxID=6573 RepID=A0A210QW73_MIZYE|nr:cytochrome P450 2J6-like [Mizuhopecten yessoensis]OWF52912.1 Cytochrome P450 2J6 [Mizuhopecten yessoensis]
MDFGSLFSFNTVTVAFVVVLLILLVSRTLQWPANVPPGPSGYPIIGSMPLLRKGNVLETFRKLRAQYGDVFSLKIGPNLNVVINGKEALREAFVKRGEEFSDRPGGFMTENIFHSKGIGFSSGEHWKQTRTFSLSTLRNFGFGKKSLESRVQEEIEAYLKFIEKQEGQPYDMKKITTIAISNIICSITFGNRFEYTDAKFKRLTSLFAENFRLLSVGGALRSFPGVRFLPGDMFNVKKLIQNFADIKSFVFEQIAEHRKTYEEENQRDFVDAFLRQQIKHGEDDPIFEDMNLTTSVMNLFGAGTDTTATIIRWAIIYLIHNKPIQDKLRQEIESVVGTSRLPSLGDKPSMPYYEAFITEVLRMGNIAPLSVPHGALKDIHFRGMIIPKGSLIIQNLDSVMTDPDLFENPDKFQPERFLGKDGQMNGKERTVMAFSLGRRICLGESLARLELFLFLTSLLQRFEFFPESPDKLPSFDATLGLVRASKDYKCCAVKLK